MIYFVIFLIAFILFFFSDRSTGPLNTIYASLAILLICLFSAFRDETIGTDILAYGKSAFYSGQLLSLDRSLFANQNANAPLFYVITWVFTRITGSFSGMLFGIQLASVLPAYICFRLVSKDDRRETSFTAIPMLCYLFTVYPFSLNALKQGIAISYILLAGIFAQKRKPVEFLLAIIVAVGFHLTSIIGLALYPLSVTVDNRSGKRFFGRLTSPVYFIIGFLTLLFVFTNGDTLVRAIAPFRGAYAYQVMHIGQGKLQLNWLVFTIVYTLLFSSMYSRLPKKDGKVFLFFYLVVLIGLFMFQLDLIAESLSRFAYYGLVFLPVVLSLAWGNEVINVKWKIILLMVLVASVFLYANVIMGYQDIYPYTSRILGIYA